MNERNIDQIIREKTDTVLERGDTFEINIVEAYDKEGDKWIRVTGYLYGKYIEMSFSSGFERPYLTTDRSLSPKQRDYLRTWLMLLWIQCFEEVDEENLSNLSNELENVLTPEHATLKKS